MALGDRLAGDVHRRRRTTRQRDLTTQPQRAQPRTEVEDPDRPAPHLRPNQKRRDADQIRPSPKTDRWIEVQGVPVEAQASDLLALERGVQLAEGVAFWSITATECPRLSRDMASVAPTRPQPMMTKCTCGDATGFDATSARGA